MDRRILNPLIPHNLSSSPLHLAGDVLRKGFPYSRRLHSHTSCVNALTFSSGDGQYLASGGDGRIPFTDRNAFLNARADLLVKLWDFHQEDITSPMCQFGGPAGNIFTLAFSANNRYLYGGGVCERVFRYDLTTLENTNMVQRPGKTYLDPEGSIREISCHPFNENLCIVASEDGTVRRYDARSPATEAPTEGVLQLRSEITGVQYHPQTPHLFVTSDNRGSVSLRDERASFGNRQSSDAVMEYNTKLTRRSAKHLARPEVSSICFDRDGEKLAATLLHYLPTIYTLSDPNPVAVCSGKFLPNGSLVPPGERTYANSCTMKHGHFGGPGLASDEFYGAGSDDFRGYLWRIPPVSQLLEARMEISPTDWPDVPEPNTLAFTQGYSAPKYIPRELSTPACRLNGHRSIVNTVLFHPRLLHVVTAGIEKDVILHSPTPGSPCARDLEETPREVRSLSGNAEEDRLVYMRSLIGDLSDNDRDEDRTISMFDHILRAEGEVDIFTTNRWIPVSDSSDEASSNEGSSEDDDGGFLA